MFILMVILLLIVVNALEIIVPTLGLVLPILAIGFDIFIAFLIVKWIIELILKLTKK